MKGLSFGRKMKKKVLFVILILLIAVSAVACSAEIEYRKPYVTEIAVTNFFHADEYIAGDSLNLEGTKLFVRYSDLKTEEIDLTAEMCSDYDMNVPEIGKVVTVNYGGKTTSFKVNVYDLTFSSVELASAPIRTQYVVGENVSTDGATINVRYEGGKVVTVKVTEKMLEAYDNQRVGEQRIYISYYGFKLFFTVNFDAKTVIKLDVLHLPNQNAVFKGYGDRIDLTGLRLRLTYDNGLMPSKEIEEEKNNVKVYIDDSEVRTVMARIAYIPADYPKTISYTYGGAALVSTGDYVYPDKEIASNQPLENVRSKTYGKVTEIKDKTIEISTVVEYEVTSPEVKVGQILKENEVIGKTGARNVFNDGGSGIILSVGDGKVKMQTAPVAAFNINVKDRSYKSMEIDRFPVTAKYGSDVNSIIQGDKLDLSSGKVRVYYDNGETQVYSMDDALVKVINSDDDLLRSEIDDLEFTTVDNVTGITAGRYELKYGLTHPYGDAVSVVATVVDETGKSVYVQQNRYVSLEAGLNYTVSLTATYNDGGKIKVSECVYYLATIGAGVRRNQLDITAAGKHKLLVIYGGVKENNVNMIVTVIQRYPVRLNILTATDNINGKSFRKGDVIPISTLQYTITYNNGDVSEPTGVTMDMLGEDCTLTCDTVVDRKEIYFRIPGTDVTSATMICKVVPMPITSIAFDTLPVDTFLKAQASDTVNVDLSGGVLRVYYENGRVEIIGQSGVLLNDLVGNASGQRIVLSYNPADKNFLSLEEIAAGVHYEATLTYIDADGAQAATALDYYIIDPDNAISAIKVVLSTDYYKRNYVQCEDWDLTGVNMIVTYAKNGTTSQPMPVAKEMIYDSTTDNIGKDIPVKVRYLGKVDATTFKINVEARMETAVSVVKTGKDLYYNTDKEPDFSGYKFSLSYNAGASAEISGLTDFAGGKNKAGWWYEIYDEDGLELTQFRRVGKKIVRIYHTTEITDGANAAYAHVYTEFPIEVLEKTINIVSVAYEDDSLGTWNNLGKKLNVLEITAHGWELFLNKYDSSKGYIDDKYLTVNYEDGTVGYVKITSDMVIGYDKADLTKGYRAVTVKYKTFAAEVCVQVLNAAFTAIAVEKTPVTNFIAGSELTKNGGIVRCVYEVTDGDGTKWNFYKYLDMDDDNVTCSGFNSNISESVDNVSQDITLKFRDKTTTYQIIVYNKQAIEFKYQNTIFFYGNTKAASATPLQRIPEFDLPASSDIIMWYVSSEFFINEEDFEQYLIDNGDVTRGEFMSLICVGGVKKYVNKKYLQSVYPIEPLKKGFDRFIVMEVLGNTYYRQENYCLQKYTVIPKVIEVKVVSYTEDAYTLDYTVSGENNLPKVILYLYEHLDEIVGSYVGKNGITSIEMLSPNKNFFRIGIFVAGSFTDVDLLDGIFAAITKKCNEYLQSTSVSANVSKKRKGINVGEYNGINPEYVSYRLSAGETLTLNGILELLEGSPELKNYDYSTGLYDVAVGTLKHGEDHYTIDFTSGKYKVLTRAIDEYACTGNWDKNTNTLTVSLVDYLARGVSMYVVNTSDKQSREIGEDEFSYYTAVDMSDGTKLTEKPSTAGTYYVKVAADDSFSMNGTNVKITFTLIITE